MIDYNLGKIYCIRSHQTDDIYIGSTCQKTLAVRLGGHKDDYKKWLNGKGNYVSSFEILKYDDCYIELLQEYPCRNKHLLNRKEGEFIRKMKCVNKNIAGRTRTEYSQDNKDKITEKTKQYRQDNKEKIKQYQQDNKERISEQIKQYRQNNKEQISKKCKEYRKNNKVQLSEYDKQYYQDNKEKLSERLKQHYQDNKEKILEKRKQKVTCECGSVVSKGNLSTHKKTKKHIDIMNKEKIQIQNK